MSNALSALICLLLATLLMLPAGPAHAYIGPGAGLGAFAVVLALGAGVLFLIVGLVWYPLKRKLRRKRESQNNTEGPENE